jgi:hypothetical protein
MPITKEHVTEVLRDPHLQKMRFSVGPINISARQFEVVSDFINSGSIQVVPTKMSYSEYVPQKNMLKTKDSDVLDLQTKTNIVHECTHIISDIDEVKVTRLTDEAAGYLAQVTYAILLEPSLAEPPIGIPINDMMRMCMKFVKKYKLVQPSGQKIDQSDITSLASAIRAIPEYSRIGEKEMLAADGIRLNSDQAREMLRIGLTRLLDERMNEDEAKRISMKVRYVTYENYVTHDPELLSLFTAFQRGGQKAALQKLFHIFWHIDQRSADRLQQRMSTSVRGDVVSQRFQSVFSAQVKAALLAALRSPR